MPYEILSNFIREIFVHFCDKIEQNRRNKCQTCFQNRWITMRKIEYTDTTKQRKGNGSENAFAFECLIYEVPQGKSKTDNGNGNACICPKFVIKNIRNRKYRCNDSTRVCADMLVFGIIFWSQKVPTRKISNSNSKIGSNFYKTIDIWSDKFF